MKRLRLHFGRIEDELRDVQHDFPAINAVLNCRRDDFTDTVRQNVLAAYGFLDAVVDGNVDFFSREGLEALLQLNHLVLLGQGYDTVAFRRHITGTRQQFFKNFRTYVSAGIASIAQKIRIRSRRKSMWACLANHNCFRKAIIARDR